MLNLAIFSYAMPYLRNLPPYNQVLNMWSFWITTSGVAFMTFTLTFAGVVQTHLQRVLGGTYMEVQDQLALFYWMRLGAGVVTMIGGFMFIYAVLGPARVEKPAWIEAAPQPANLRSAAEGVRPPRGAQGGRTRSAAARRTRASFPSRRRRPTSASRPARCAS